MKTQRERESHLREDLYVVFGFFLVKKKMDQGTEFVK